MFGDKRRLGESGEECERRLAREVDDERYERERVEREREYDQADYDRAKRAAQNEFQGLQNDYELLSSDKAAIEADLEAARADLRAAIKVAKDRGFAGNDTTCEQLVRNILTVLEGERQLNEINKKEGQEGGDNEEGRGTNRRGLLR